MKVAIITGASSGIGQSAAIQIAKRGTGVILTYGNNARGGVETAAAKGVGHVIDRPHMAAEPDDALPGTRVPDAYGGVPARCGQTCAVR
ncbi:SDR family NAD(P)-dependent oxidoreductase [Streptomyces mirabilis]